MVSLDEMLHYGNIRLISISLIFNVIQSKNHTITGGISFCISIGEERELWKQKHRCNCNRSENWKYVIFLHYIVICYFLLNPPFRQEPDPFGWFVTEGEGGCATGLVGSSYHLVFGRMASLFSNILS